VIRHLQKQVQNKCAYHPHAQSSLLPSLWVAMTTSSETQQWVVHKCTIMLFTVWPRQNYYTKAQPGPHGWRICLWLFFFPLPIFWVEFGGWCQVDLCFDQLVFKLSEQMFSHYKSLAARYK
jgi:hypothetical protein